MLLLRPTECRRHYYDVVKSEVRPGNGIFCLKNLILIDRSMVIRELACWQKHRAIDWDFFLN